MNFVTAEARVVAITEMCKDAQRKGANAGAGASPDCEVVWEGMLMVAAGGTSVYIE